MRLWRVDDVMTRDVVAVDEQTPYQTLVDLLIAHGVSALPVVNHCGQVVGIVSETDLLHKVQVFDGRRWSLSSTRRRRDRAKARGGTARDLMSPDVVSILPSISVPVAAERMLAAGVRRLPVEDDLGRLIGIVTRSDLLKVQRAEAVAS